jgi:hypothetical protein
MCFCERPTRNDQQPGYKIEQAAPALKDGDCLIYDECGRCSPQVAGKGCTDYHSHHFRLVDNRSEYFLLVRHGGGDERFSLGYHYTRTEELLLPLDSDARFLLLYSFYRINREASQHARNIEHSRWVHAAAEKRIKIIHHGGRRPYKEVRIEPNAQEAA